MNFGESLHTLRFLTVIAICSAAPTVAAQQFISNVGSGCAVPAVGGTITVPAAVAVAAGDTLLVALAVGSDAVPEFRVSDARNNVYRPFGAERANERRFAALSFLAPVSTALTSGDALRVHVDHPTPGMEVCFRASVFRRVAGSADALDTHGGREASGTSLTLNTSAASVGGTFNYATFAFSGDAGTVATQGTVTAQARVCTAGNTLCLVTAYDTGTAAGIQTVAVSTTNSVPWAGSLSALYAGFELFKNGFE